MGSHRDSHTVAQFYLRGFAKDGHVVAIANGRARRRGVRKATVEPDAYALIDNQGALYQGFENPHFSNVERIGAAPHRLLRSGVVPTGAEWLGYIMYLALGIVRTRRSREMSRKATSVELAALAPEGSREQRQVYMNNLFFRLWPRVIWVLGQLDYRLTQVPNELPLITADHPVGIWTDRPDEVRELGLLRAPLLVHPVDRHRTLWFKKPMDRWPRWLEDPFYVAANANWAMLQMASPEIIVHPDDVEQFVFATPEGSAPALPTTRVHLARALPLWLPTVPPRDDPPSWAVEDALRRSDRSRFQAFVARELRVPPEDVLAATLKEHDTAEWAAILSTPRGITVPMGTIQRRTAA